MSGLQAGRAPHPGANSLGSWHTGIRVAVLGAVFYAFMVAICSPWAWRSELPAVHRLRLAAVVTGIGFVLYLIYAKQVEAGEVCPYCTSVRIITFLLFSLIVFQASGAGGTLSGARGAGK